jgi:hypothetical protein
MGVEWYKGIFITNRREEKEAPEKNGTKKPVHTPNNAGIHENNHGQNPPGKPRNQLPKTRV